MIELRNIGFSYGRYPLFTNVNLVIGDNDFTAIIGSNGCGKTTLVRLILGLLKPTEGEIIYSIEGRRVPRLSMGYLPQCSAVDRQFPITVRDVVALGLLDKKSICGATFARHEREVVANAISRMELTSLSECPISRLSGGELQRTLLARAIVSSPNLLVLDEPNTYLDYRSENRLYDYLHEINRDCAIVLVGHDIANIRKNAKKVFCLDGSEE